MDHLPPRQHDPGSDAASGAIAETASGTIAAQVSEAWLSTLEVNAAFDRPWVEAAIDWASSGSPVARPGTRVVDVGCGAGGAATAFASRLAAGPTGAATAFPRRLADGPTGAATRDAPVVGLDRDPRLLAIARHRATTEGVADRVRFACGAVGRLPVQAGSVDLVWASGVVHHVADQQAAVGELAGLLRPGGRLVLVEGGLPLRCLPDDDGIGRPGLEARLDEARARWFADMRAELAGPPLPYGWPAALTRAGLADVRTRSFIAEATAPLDDVGRAIAVQHLTSARDELGDRLAPDDRATLRRLLDPAEPASVHRRDDLTVTAVRTVHVAVRV